MRIEPAARSCGLVGSVEARERERERQREGELSFMEKSARLDRAHRNGASGVSVEGVNREEATGERRVCWRAGGQAGRQAGRPAGRQTGRLSRESGMDGRGRARGLTQVNGIANCSHVAGRNNEHKISKRFFFRERSTVSEGASERAIE